MKDNIYTISGSDMAHLLRQFRGQFLLILLGLSIMGCSSTETTTDAGTDTAIEEPADMNVEEAETPELADRDNTGANVMLEARMQEPYGAYLTDGSGRTLYIFLADTAQTSTCYGPCAEAWPPLITEGGDPMAGAEVNESLIGTTERTDGRMQVTYNGWPLYYYVKDQAAGQFTGQDIMGFGAEWYMIAPSGEQVHAEGN